MIDGMVIKKITVVCILGTSCCEVGVDGVVKIKDYSEDYKDSVYSAYTAYDSKGNIVRIIENCPVDIEYRREGK